MNRLNWFPGPGLAVCLLFPDLFKLAPLAKMPSADAGTATAPVSKPEVSTKYRWENGHTVSEEDGKRVIPLINVQMLDGSDADKEEFFKLLKYAVTEVS